MKYPNSLRLRSLLGGALVAGLALSANADNIVEKLADRPEFSTLVTAVTEAGLVDALASAEDITILAPTNEAFAKISEDDLASLLADREALTNLLTYHVIPERISFRDFEPGATDTLLAGNGIDISVQSFFWGFYRTVTIDDAVITRANLRADNGIIHTINEVLDPGYQQVPTILEIAADNPEFSILASLVEQAGIARALDSEHYNLTVFAPTNAAFEALGEETLEAVQADRRLLRKILKNHLVRGARDSSSLVEDGSAQTVLGLSLPLAGDPDAPTGFSIAGEPLEAVDIVASNGIIHVVGGVLVPPPPQSLVDIASSREELSTLVTALNAAELASTFDTTQRWPAFTIFAPDNAAFAALPEGTLDALLADPTGALADILSLHVVAGRLEADRLSDGQVLESLSGDRLTVRIADGEVTINGAPVVETDLKARNGVLHIVGNVISRESFTVADLVASKPYLSTLLAAADAADLATALADTSSDLTVLAPVNRAFNSLPEGSLEALLETPEGTLRDILLNHVISGSQTAGDLVEDGSATTLLGTDLEITSQRIRFWWWRTPYRVIRVNGTRVLATNLEADNGLVHLIHGVLLPEEGDNEAEGDNPGNADTGEDNEAPSDNETTKGEEGDVSEEETAEEDPAEGPATKN